MSQINTSSVQLNVRAEKSTSKLIGWIKYMIFLLFVFYIFHNVIGLTKVSGYSMNPTFQDGELLLVSKVATFYKEPKLGDIAILSQPDQGIDIVKRVIGVANDVVKIQDSVVYVNNDPIPEVTTVGKSIDMPEQTVPNGTVFVMGDNRTPGESLDSRDESIGPISVDLIKGYVVYSLRPFHSIPKPLEFQ